MLIIYFTEGCKNGLITDKIREWTIRMTENTPLSPRRQRSPQPGGTVSPAGPGAGPGPIDKRKPKVFKKCESATFHLDGAIYTIGK